MNLIYPRIARDQWSLMLTLALAGGLVGGLYGIANDEITFTLGPEYFTTVKFKQFAWADLGLPRRLFVAEIGFLAAGVVGFFAGWLMARLAVPAWPRAIAVRRVAVGFAIILCTGLAGGTAGWLLGRAHDSDFSNWQSILEDHHVTDARAFVLVAYIHNASYLGAVAGLLIALGWFAASRRARDSKK